MALPTFPIGGNIQTHKAVLDGTFSAGDLGIIDTDGKISVIGSANVGRPVVVSVDGVATEEVEVFTAGIFETAGGNASGGALLRGAKLYARDAVTFDAGSTADTSFGRVVGPTTSVASAALIQWELQDNAGAKA